MPTADYEDMKATMRRIYNECSSGGNGPDVMIFEGKAYVRHDDETVTEHPIDAEEDDAKA